MKHKTITGILNSIFILAFIQSPVLGNATTKVSKLSCEYLTNPVGLDVSSFRLSWQIQSTENNVLQSAYELRVASEMKLLEKPDVWSSGKVVSAQSVNVPFQRESLRSGQRMYWQVRIWDNKGGKSAWSSPAFFEMGLLNPSDWQARWIAFGQEKEDRISKPAQYFRREFIATKSIKSARAYVTALGLYQLYINGQKVSADLFTPGWTSYNKRLQYQTYDVTAMLQKQNAIAAVVSDGWYRGHIGFGHQHDFYGKKLGLLARLHIDYTDGTFETIGTDDHWKVCNNGPITSSDIYNGECYDATKELSGWSRPGYADAAWNNATLLDHTYNTLIASQSVPVRATTEIKVKKQIKTRKGEAVYDFGQNMVGWVRARLNGRKGDTITFRFAEVLDKDGNFYTDNLRNAESTDIYIVKGEPGEVFEPHFTFHGFRYLKVSGNSVDLSPDCFTGVVVHSDMLLTGNFSCSDSLINKLQHNIQWGQRSNFLDVPTDCPQRDERLGWTGDAQVFSMTAAYNFNVAPFFSKWMADLSADQFEDGRVPHVIPNVIGNDGGSTAWADVSVIVPWNMYLIYNDKQILERQYASMKNWVEYMKRRAGDDYLWTDDYHFGDWLAYATTWSDYPGATTEKDLIATAYYCYSTTLLGKIASILGKTDDAAAYNKLAENVKSAFCKEYVTANGRLVSHTQTAYVLALAFNLLPESVKPKAADFLAKDVRKFGHLTTGFVGTPLLCGTLSSIGHDDLAYMLLNNKNYPSWLYPVLKGATTIWERWDGIKPDGSFQDVGMNSFNHYAYGAIGDWLYRHVAGIDFDVENPGYKHFILAPHPGGGLTNAVSELESVYGKIVSKWTVVNNEFGYEVVIPANTSASVTLPYATLAKVKLNNHPVGSKATQEDHKVSLELGSGKYTFAYPADEMKLATVVLK
jgi:Glycogen debranching enzyme